MTLDSIELLEYGFDILCGKCENDLNKEDLLQLKLFKDELIEAYLHQEDNDKDIEYTKSFCICCKEIVDVKIIYSENDQILECQQCGNCEVV